MTDNKTTPMPEPMTMEEFEALPKKGTRSWGGGRGKSEQRKIVEAMVPGNVLKLSHAGLEHGGPSSCSFRAMLQKLKESSEYRYSNRHLADGRVAVACFKKGVLS